MMLDGLVKLLISSTLSGAASAFVHGTHCIIKASSQVHAEPTGSIAAGNTAAAPPPSEVHPQADGEPDDVVPFPHWRGMYNYDAANAAHQPTAGVILMDPFCKYLGQQASKLVMSKGYAAVQVLSPYTIAGLNDPALAEFAPPPPGTELSWALQLPFPVVGVLCESDAGLEAAESLRSALCGPESGGVNSARRDKYLMNEALRGAGLGAPRQIKTGCWEEARRFLQDLAGDRPVFRAVVKPYRGCASGDVFMCGSMEEAERSFHQILGTPLYGTPGALFEEVLLQEFIEGQEYVVDTVSRNGEHKVMAVWKYDKRPANGAPFVYHATELRPVAGEAERLVASFARLALDALGLRCGPTHTEVVLHPKRGPMLMEVNARWHLTDFAPLVDDCVGYNAVAVAVDALIDPEAFDAIPPEPVRLLKEGRVVHLVSHVQGTLTAIRHLREIEALESVTAYDIYPKFTVGSEITPTIDIRTDAGWVRLIHEDPAVLEADYRAILAIQPTMFEVEGVEDPPQQ